MKSRLIAFLIFLAVLISLTSVNVFASNESIFDEANMLDSKERTEISKAISSFEDKTGLDFVLVMHRDGIINPYKYAKGDFILLEIEQELGIYYYELYVYGSADDRIMYSESDRMLDNKLVYESIKSGNFEDGVVELLRVAEIAYMGNYQEPFWQTLLIAFAIALLVSGAICGAVIYSYKRKLKSASYPLERYARLELRSKNDIFLGSTVSKVRINTSSSGRGGGGSRGGSRGRR